MTKPISAFIIYGQNEHARQAQVNLMQEVLPNSVLVDPIFPARQKVPFINDLIKNAYKRSGYKLLPSEVGVFMSHRSIWKKIVEQNNEPNQHFLVLESDSKINDMHLIEQTMQKVETEYDLFFWGAWNNHVSIKKSTAESIDNKYKIGAPLIRSVYGAYGYSLNIKAAKHLLAQSSKINYPVDLYKHYVDQVVIKIGAIQPELISTWQTTDSTIRKEANIDRLKRIIIIKIFSLRNQILAYFC
jgi:GR25 family glycosyltransferase involved in LPS biosynthesis